MLISVIHYTLVCEMLCGDILYTYVHILYEIFFACSQLQTLCLTKPYNYELLVPARLIILVEASEEW
jgi:hypothetical protein